MRFHILEVKNWLETELEEVYPAEIGVVEMSLEKGVYRRLNQRIWPGELPPGYKADMKIRSEKYHQMWFDNNHMSENYDVSKYIFLFSIS